MIYKRFMVLSNMRNVHIYAYYCVFISPAEQQDSHFGIMQKYKWKSKQIIFLSKELQYIQEAAYCKVKILLLLNKKRATLLHINELIPEEERKKYYTELQRSYNLISIFHRDTNI